MSRAKSNSFDCRIKSARGGDSSALADLINAYRQYLQLLARMQLNPSLRVRVSASDLAQESILRAQSPFASFRGETEAELLAWLRRILASQLAYWTRYHTAQRRDIHLERRFSDALDQSSAVLAAAIPARGLSPSEQAIQREEGVALAEALSRLPQSYAEVILARHLEGRPFAEIAASMNRTEPAVKSIWTRAFTRLRQELKKDE
jgi:RNA polymerase sigma-70 factor (ECF subfamily)